MRNIMSIGIVGHTGMVGKAVYDYFKQKTKYKTYGYSRKEPGDKELVNSADVIFICVPTPFRWNDDGFDLSGVESVLKEIKAGKIVVIKSTVVIGTTEDLQWKYPQLKILFNPEFLSEATAFADFINPDRQFIGYTEKSFDVAETVMRILPLAPFEIICKSQEAELLKYVNNLHGALEVIEANHYYEVCEQLGLDYEKVKRAMVSSKYMGKHYKEIFHKGYRGVGGKCFPKDLNAYIDWAKEKGIHATLFEAVRKTNRRILAEQGLSEEEAEKK